MSLLFADFYPYPDRGDDVSHFATNCFGAMVDHGLTEIMDLPRFHDGFVLATVRGFDQDEDNLFFRVMVIVKDGDNPVTVARARRGFAWE